MTQQTAPPKNNQTKNNQNLEASFSVLVMSIASTAAMSLGLAPNPQTGKVELNAPMARFNIDLLAVLKDKTINNLNSEEKHLIESLLSDLQLKFVQNKI
jgi:hypothetical protein